jgi:ribose/xylose/arabinose/galactoside ABC-type transport system permease subunit
MVMSLNKKSQSPGNSRSLIEWFIKDRQRLQTFVTLTMLILMMIVFSSISDRFFQISNMFNVARQITPMLIVASAANLLMIARGLDLSVGSMLAANSVLAAYLASHGTPIWQSYLAALALGSTIGFVNALVVVRLKVSPIIATLGTMSVGRGIAYLISPSAILVGLPKSWDWLGTSFIVTVPTSPVIAVGIFLLFNTLLSKTIFGRHVYAIGGNEETARLSGVNVERVLSLLYILVGAATVFASLILASRVGSGDPNIGMGFELQVIVAIILGGTTLSGGEGRVTGTLIGVLILGFLKNGLNLAGVEPFWQYIAEGVVLIFAVALDRFINIRVGSSTKMTRKVSQPAVGFQNASS